MAPLSLGEEVAWSRPLARGIDGDCGELLIIPYADTAYSPTTEEFFWSNGQYREAFDHLYQGELPYWRAKTRLSWSVD